MPRCRHGEFTVYEGELTSGESRKATEHEQKCRKRGEVFGHPGTILGLWRHLCCTGCGKDLS